MSKLNERSLPPNTDGLIRGNVELKVHDIRWKNSAAFHSTTVLARVIWWGESFQSAAILKIDKRQNSNSTRSVNYCIRTSHPLFLYYIKTCEPIEIKLSSGSTNAQIGTSFIKIPLKLINLLTSNTGDFTAYHKNSYKIFSPKNLNLGDISVSIEMTVIDDTEMPSVVSPLHLTTGRSNVTAREDTQSDALLFKKYKDLDPQNKTVNDTFSYDMSETERRKNTYNYLTGRAMSKSEEEDALNTLKNMSPPESIIEEINNETINSTQLTEDSLLSKIDSIKITFLSLALTKAGIRELQMMQENTKRQMGDESNFIVECKLNNSLQLLSHQHGKNEFESVRIHSKNVGDNLGSRIPFHQSIVQPIIIPTKKSPLHCIHFKIWFRDLAIKKTTLFGTAAVPIKVVVESEALTTTHIATISSTTGDIKIGSLAIKIELGSRGIHFGKDFLDAIMYNKENISNIELHSAESMSCGNLIQHDVAGEIGKSNFTKLEKRTTARKCNHDEQDSGDLNKPSSSDNISTEKQMAKSCAECCGNRASNNTNDSMKIDSLSSEMFTPKFLYGLIYIGTLQYFKNPPRDVDTFMVCRTFWKAAPSTTNMLDNNVFNFLEIFPVICDNMFFERTRNQCVQLEMWQKLKNNPEQMVGGTSLPLHQFHVAFRDPTIMNQLNQMKLPIISFDGWSSIVSPLTFEPIAKLQVILAIGTEEQLDYLRSSRGLSNVAQHPHDFSLKDRIQPSFAQSNQHFQPCQNQHQTQGPSISNAGTQTNFTSHQSDAEIQTIIPNGEFATTGNCGRQSNLAEMLNNFIGNLASRLPERKTENNPQNASPPTQQQFPLRRTSDLLDALQRALLCPPPQNVNLIQATTQTSDLSPQTTSGSSFIPAPFISAPFIHQPEEFLGQQFNVLIEIENALHIPKISIRVNKKCTKQRIRCSSSHSFRGISEVEPSTYVTFEANGPPTNLAHSMDGPVYTTNVVEKTSNPQWNKRFEVMLPVELITNDEKRFILKVWRKASTDIPQARLLPNPTEDVMIGFTAIDLSVLLLGMPTISGWYNIVDFSGRINGQMKVNIQPMQDLKVYQPHSSVVQMDSFSSESLSEPSSTLASAYNVPLYGEQISIDSASNLSISRALKRKFNELEEIKLRLKARLFDVTGDENFDPDDEFEKDLNTHPDEDEESVQRHELAAANNNNDFDWLRSDMPNEQNENENETDEKNGTSVQLFSAFDFFHTTKTYTIPVPTEQGSSGLKSIVDWENLFQQQDIEDILHPNLIKKLIDPSLISNMENTTPREQIDLNVAPDEIITPDENITSNENDTPDSSSSEQDRIRLISNALQKANINDILPEGETFRESPDGDTNSVNEK